MNIRNEIYSMIATRGLLDSEEADAASEKLSQADKRLLIHDIDVFYNKWIECDHALEENWTEELLHKKHVQESSFEIACTALAFKGDASVIPYFLKYVPLDEWNWKVEANMEDYNAQNLERCIVNPDYYGEAYIPVLLSHIHELVPEKMRKADKFLYTMLLDDLDCFETTHPLFNNLRLAEKEPFMKLLDFSLQTTLEETSRERKVPIEVLKEEILKEIPEISYNDSPLIKVAYLRQEFLKLYASD